MSQSLESWCNAFDSDESPSVETDPKPETVEILSHPTVIDDEAELASGTEAALVRVSGVMGTEGTSWNDIWPELFSGSLGAAP